MVAHDHKGMEQPFAAFTGFEKARLKRGLCTELCKYPPAMITPVDDVVNRARKFETKLVGHAVKPTAFGLLESATASARNPHFMGIARVRFLTTRGKA
jgi:hypothetical protein